MLSLLIWGASFLLFFFEKERTCLLHCSRQNPAHRPSAYEILHDPWLTGGVASTKEIYNAVKNLKRFNIRRKFRAVRAR
jgi:hypothetical protein